MRAIEQVEKHLFSLIVQIDECRRTIKAAEEAQRKMRELRRELVETAREYAEASETAEAMKGGRI